MGRGSNGRSAAAARRRLAREPPHPHPHPLAWSGGRSQRRLENSPLMLLYSTPGEGRVGKPQRCAKCMCVGEGRVG